MSCPSRLPILWFILFAGACAVVLGSGWLPQTPSHEELIAYADKLQGLQMQWQQGGLGWWIDGYLGGFSGAAVLSYAASLLPYAILTLGLPPVLAFKVGGLFLWVLGGVSAWAFGRRLSGSVWTAWWIGVLYLFSAQVLFRLGWLEHMTIVTVFPLVPLCFLAIQRLAERGSPWDAVLLGASFSAVLICWSKMGATLAPLLAAYAVCLFVSRPNSRSFLLRGALWATPVAILLGILPLLPLIREFGFMTIFSLGPFADWQTAYSVKTAASWLDRGGDLFQGLPALLRVDQGGYYLGLIPLIAVGVVMVRTWRKREEMPGGMAIFLGLALAVFWLSFGPRSVLSGHFEFLSGALKLSDAAIPLPWLTLIAPGLVLWWILPPSRVRPPLFLALAALYYLVPGFVILERVPGFGQLRAPDSFWILNGTLCWAVAGGIAIAWCLGRWVQARWLLSAGFAMTALILADASANMRSFFRPGLPLELYRDFDAATDYLKKNTQPGRVMALSGRYFYSGVPWKTGRPLSSEAAHHNFMLRDTARLEAAGKTSPKAFQAYLNVSGISHVLLDRKDSFISPDYPAWLATLMPIVFENDGFTIFENRGVLYPGFFAQQSRGVSNASPLQVLTDAEQGVLLIDSSKGQEYSPLPVAASLEKSRGFMRIAPLTQKPGNVVFPIGNQAGVLVLTEAWHPDWQVRVDGRPRPVWKAAGAFPAVEIKPADRVVEFAFRAPGWYSAAALAAGMGWIVVLAGLALVPILPAATRRKWIGSRVPAPVTPPLIVRPEIRKAIAIVPTYNETESILALIDRLLALPSDLSALIVDDASPDGTAAKVRGHAAFGQRLFLLERAGKLGLGTAYREGFQWAIDRSYDACIEIDADFSHNPDDIPKLIAGLNSGWDAAIGSRYLGGVRVLDWPQHRLFLSMGASTYVRTLTRLPLSDATSGFKAIRTSALATLPANAFCADGYGFQIELHWLLWSRGFVIREVPIIFTERREGQTKMSRHIAFEAAVRVLQLALTPKPEIVTPAVSIR